MCIIIAYVFIALSVLVLARKTMQLEKEAERNQLIQSYMVTLQGFYQKSHRLCPETALLPQTRYVPFDTHL